MADDGAFNFKQVDSLYSLYYNKSLEAYSNLSLDFGSIESFWTSLHLRYQAFYVYLCVYGLVVLFYGIAGLFFWVVERLDIWREYKLQADINSNENYWICIKNLATNYLLVIVPLILTAWPIISMCGVHNNKPFPSLYQFIGHIALCVIGEDFFQYWFHRMLHLPWFYKHIHKIHHQFATPFGLSASYSHPAEVIILGIASFLPAMIISSHLFTFYCWLIIRQLDAVLTHCGYDVPYNVLHYLPFYGGTSFHDFHHTSFLNNYASRFTWVDLIFGTYKEPPYVTERIKKRD